MTAQDILSRLQGVRGGRGQWTARCPAYDDRQNSLSVSEGNDGRVLLHCHAGCDVDKITAALGISKSDLFPDKPRDHGTPEREHIYPGGQLKKVMYRKADGSKYGCWFHRNGNAWAKGRGGAPPTLYIVGELAGAVFVCEGEKDADTLHRLGYNAASGADGAGPGKWRKEYTEQLRGCSVCVLFDNDDVGRAYAVETCNALHGVASSVQLLDIATVWPEVPLHGDVSDMVTALGPERACDLIGEMIAAAPQWVPQEAPATAAKKPILTPMAAVEAREPSYLISPYLPRGMLAIMGGESGSGKTYLALSWAAAISNGQRLPFQRQTDPAPPAGYVYYFTQENDPNTVIRPRLDLLGANLDRILIQYQDGKTAYDPLTMNDLRLEEAAKEYPPTMVIFDPIQSYLGDGVDMNKAERVRPVLDWLGDYAKRHDCTIVLVSHMSKPGAGNAAALDRLLGSSDFRNAARSIIIVGRDPSDKETRVFAHGKNSIGEPGPSQKYRISGRGVTYTGPSDLTADDIIKQSTQGRDKPAATLTAIMAKLEELLGPEGWATLEQVETWQTLEGIAKSTLYNARKELALQTASIGKPPNRKTWWLRSDVDMEWFKAIHTPDAEPTEQLELST